MALFISQRSTEPKVVVSDHLVMPNKSIISLVGLQLLIVLMIALGVIVGSVDILSVTFGSITTATGDCQFSVIGLCSRFMCNGIVFEG